MNLNRIIVPIALICAFAGVAQAAGRGAGAGVSAVVPVTRVLAQQASAYAYTRIIQCVGTLPLYAEDVSNLGHDRAIKIGGKAYEKVKNQLETRAAITGRSWFEETPESLPRLRSIIEDAYKSCHYQEIYEEAQKKAADDAIARVEANEKLMQESAEAIVKMEEEHTAWLTGFKKRVAAKSTKNMATIRARFGIADSTPVAAPTPEIAAAAGKAVGEPKK